MIEVQEPKFKVGDRVKSSGKVGRFVITNICCLVQATPSNPQVGEWRYTLMEDDPHALLDGAAEQEIQLANPKST